MIKYLSLFLIMIFNVSYSQEIGEILESRQFVLEANKVTDSNGMASSGSRKLCFILIDSSNIVVQWISGSDNNGLGGITIHGDIIKFEITKSDVMQETQYIVNLKSKMDQGRVHSDIRIEIFSKSHAVANLKHKSSSFFIPEEMDFRGYIVPLESTKVVVGSN